MTDWAYSEGRSFRIQSAWAVQYRFLKGLRRHLSLRIMLYTTENELSDSNGALEFFCRVCLETVSLKAGTSLGSLSTVTLAKGLISQMP